MKIRTAITLLFLPLLIFTGCEKNEISKKDDKILNIALSDLNATRCVRISSDVVGCDYIGKDFRASLTLPASEIRDQKRTIKGSGNCDIYLIIFLKNKPDSQPLDTCRKGGLLTFEMSNTSKTSIDLSAVTGKAISTDDKTSVAIELPPVTFSIPNEVL